MLDADLPDAQRWLRATREPALFLPWQALDAAAAERIAAIFTEVVIAPDASDEAKAIFARKKNLRLLLTGGLPDPAAPGTLIRSVSGGFLAQSRDAGRVAMADLRVVTKREPTAQEMLDLVFAFRVCKHVKSNAIVLARAVEGGFATVGIGTGQPSRVDAVALAVQKAGEKARGAVLASDAFFPFPDGVELALDAGITAIVQPGGSVRDQLTVEAAQRAGVTMYFTGTRHFAH